MRSWELTERLRGSKRSVFSIADIAKLSGKDGDYVKLLLHRLTEKGSLVRIEKNKYSLPDLNPLSVASSLTFPCYISFISAYSYYGLTSQIPSTISVVSLRQKKPVPYHGYEIRFIKFSRRRFFGYTREYVEGRTVFIAEPEKAILDSLLLPRYCPISETFSALKEAKLNHEKLLGYVERLNSRIAAKRLGYLLEAANIDLYGSLKNFIGRNYELLNPLKPPTNRRNVKWKIIVNEALE